MTKENIVFNTWGDMKLQVYNHQLMRVMILASQLPKLKESKEPEDIALAVMAELRLEGLVIEGDWPTC